MAVLKHTPLFRAGDRLAHRMQNDVKVIVWMSGEIVEGNHVYLLQYSDGGADWMQEYIVEADYDIDRELQPFVPGRRYFHTESGLAFIYMATGHMVRVVDAKHDTWLDDHEA